MANKIDIDTKTFVRFWLVILGFVLAAVLLWKAQTGLLILGVSLFLALALNQPVAAISKRLPGRSRVAAAAVAYGMVVVFLGIIVFLVIPPIVQQTAQFVQRIPEVVESTTDQWSALRHFMEEYNLQSQLEGALASVQTTAGAWAGNIGQNLIVGLNSLFAFIAASILVLVLTFLMLIEGPEWMDRLWRLYSDKDKMKAHRRVVGRMYAVVSGYVNGQMIVSSTGALFAGAFVFILSLVFPGVVPASLAIPTGAITFLLSLVPMFGATIGGIIIALLLALNSIPAAIIYVIFFVIYQQVENNFISPRVQSKRIDLSALMVLAAVTVGLYMFGVVGGIIAIPIAGSIRVLVEEYLADRNEREEKAKPSSKQPVLIAQKTAKK